MQTGVITYFNDEKGFGFIKVDGTGPNDKGVFFHFKQFEGGNKQAIAKGVRVQFTVRENEKGPSAEDISRADDQSSDDEMPMRSSSEGMSSMPAVEATDMSDDSDEDMEEAA